MQENDKKADNILLNNKVKVSKLDMKVDENKKKLDSLDEMEEVFYSLKKNIDNCVELLNHSIKGENVTRELNAISEDNQESFTNSIKDIDSKRDEIRKEIKELYKQKEELSDKIKKEQEDKEEVDKDES